MDEIASERCHSRGPVAADLAALWTGVASCPVAAAASFPVAALTKRCRSRLGLEVMFLVAALSLAAREDSVRATPYVQGRRVR